MLINIGLMRQLKAPGGGPSDFTLYLPFTNSLSTGTWSRTTNAWNPETGAVGPHNLLTYSQDFSNAAWATNMLAFGSGSIVNAAIAPDGTQTADLVVESALNGQHLIYYTISGGSAGVFCGSIYLKYAGKRYVSFRVDNGYSPYGVLDLVTGTMSSGEGLTVSSAGNDWYRVSTTKTINAGTQYVTIDFLGSNSKSNFIYQGDGVSGVYFWGAQLELGVAAQVYVPTTSTAVYAPRYVTGKKGTGLFLERASTNKCTCYSVPTLSDTVGVKSYYSGGAWTQGVTNMTLSGDTAATLSIVTDQTAIDAAIASESLAPTGMLPALLAAKANGYKVYKLDNSAGATAANVSITGAMTAVATSIALTSRLAAGSATIGDSAGANTVALSGTTYSRAKKENFTATATRTMYITAAATGVVYFVCPTVEEVAYLTSQILCFGAATSRSAETLTYNTSGIIGSPGTVSGWWKPEAVAAGTVQTIWSSYTDASNFTALKYNGVIAYIEKAKTGQTTEYVTFPITLPTTSFTHFAILINADGTMGLYVNGVSASAGLGSELVDTANTTAGWSSYGSNTVTTDSDGIMITYVGGSQATYGARCTLSQTGGLSINLTPEKIYSVALQNKVNAGASVTVAMFVPASSSTYFAANTSTSYVDYNTVIRPSIAATDYPRIQLNDSLTTGETASFRGITVKEIYNSTSTAFAPVIASTMQIGSINNGSQADGTLDEFYCYNRVLTPAEIERLYSILAQPINVAVNDIGVPGALGFGVGICPNLPAGFTPMGGYADPTSGNFGNYQYSDGSVMVWVPAFYYKYGTGSNGLAVNAVSIKPYSAYPSVAEANADGFALHRAFYDGGAVQSGVFVDKYLCSNNNGTASSIKNAAVITSAVRGSLSTATFASLTGAPANAYYGAIAAAHTRGANFFCSSRFIFSALALLSYAHARASTATTWCAWYDATNNFPKGCNNNALRDVNDSSVLYTTDNNGAHNCGLTGSGTLFAKTTHNGQNCGVADLNGLVWEITPGLTSDGTNILLLDTAAAMKNLTSGTASANDLWGATGRAQNYTSLNTSYESLVKTNGWVLTGSANQVFSAATSGSAWGIAGAGIPLVNGTGGTNAFGNDGVYQPAAWLAELCPISGGGWNSGSGAGVWALNLYSRRTDSGNSVGFRAALYL